MRTNVPIFKVKEATVRRRYSDFKVSLFNWKHIFWLSNIFQWLRDELARTVQIMMPPLPSKAFTKQLPFISNDDGIFETEFVEERRIGLEVWLEIFNIIIWEINFILIFKEFLNKIAGHPLVQSERCLHMFLTEPTFDKTNYVPGKVIWKSLFDDIKEWQYKTVF